MLPFKLIYSDEYFLPIGAHVFPAEKYRRVHDRLIHDGSSGTVRLHLPGAGIGPRYSAGAYPAVRAEAENRDPFPA